jgi:DNA-binding NtrC family response regulator
MQILLIDDDPGARKTVSKMLQRAGHEVVECENGRDGIAYLQDVMVDLVMTDVVMPVMDGIEFIKAALQRTPSLKIIAMSGGGRTGNTDHLEAASKLGVCGVLNKPFMLADLDKSIWRCCGARA